MGGVAWGRWLARRWGRLVGTLATVAGLVTAVVLVVGAVGGHSGSTRPTPPAATEPAKPRLPPGVTLIAQLSHDIPRYATPDATKAAGVVPGSWLGSPTALPVIDLRPGWLRVRLAQRPNFSTAWIRTADARLVSTSYRIVVSVRDRHLRLYQNDKLTLDAPAGVGTPDDPTPTGEFFLALFAPPPGPGYGDFILVTSAHSTKITDWAHSGDAIVGIHGPLGADEAIGTTGAAVSHGCVRLHLADLARLRQVPAGTPISVVGSPVL
ncbi:L,D-transpeptidase [Pseudofrankia inefficax]|uniref:ErfK/YbiS/YcfS/YnhG family protein n=1 Tax=Pseudofrankia inefficax (strain DSM 45817 / CECT 9037 / DDB 130130 / EuI1c) TaxID=298654 RepID=E3J2F9_PSEI1|nr:L,D-transpeptidase [Pseudofrankia inefficax]ADP79331.1 ErfK/YbiS/YcfS/YnhG family protein [Pseudofrankia inefficax]